MRLSQRVCCITGPILCRATVVRFCSVKLYLAPGRARLGWLPPIIACITRKPGTDACNNPDMTERLSPRRPISLAILLIVTGIIGWYASFALTIDKIAVLTNPQADLDCNISVIVQCGVNLGSWQGAILGFPNPIIGLGAFVAPIAVGVALLAGATFARWFWMAFNVGVLGAFAFILWLSYQSIFNLGTLCPWCMLVWSMVIPMFWGLTLSNAKAGVFGRRFRTLGARLNGWVPAITVAGYLIIAIVAQLRLDVLSTIIL